MSSSDHDQSDQGKTLAGWFLFMILAALAVLGAFLVIDNDGDDDSAGGDSAASMADGDASDEAGPVVDLEAVQQAATGAGLQDAEALYEGERVRLNGIAPDTTTEINALAAAREHIGDLSLISGITIAEPEPPAVEEAAPLSVFDELVAQGVNPDDIVVDGDTYYVFARQGAYEGVDGADIVWVSPDERRRAALAILEANGVEGLRNATLTGSNPIGVRLTGEAPDEETRTRIGDEVAALPFVGSVTNDLTVFSPVEPVVTFNVEGGVVTLTGTVPDEETRAAVVAEAARLFGAGNVVDELEVGETAEGALRLEGQVPESSRDDINAGLTALAESLGLELDDAFTYAALSEDQAALQTSLDEVLSGIQINFASGSSALPADAPAQLDALVEVLAGAPEGTVVAVEGHTDDQGDAASNQTLSQARAESVVAYLVEAGVSEDVLRAVGNGESQPIADNGTAEGRAENRRIEFDVVL